MSALRKAFRLYIDASMHVALAVASFTYITIRVFSIQSDLILIGFVFSSTVVSYNFLKYLPAGVSPFQQPSWVPGKVLAISIASLVVSLVTLSFLPWSVVLAALTLGGITLAYAIPFSEGKRNLRNVYGVKIAVIAFVWTGTTVGLPLLNQPEIAANGNWLGWAYEAIQRFLFVCVLILPFDIRDYRSDSRALGTIPQLIGIRQAKILGFTFICVCLAIEWLQESTLSYNLLIFICISLISARAVWRSMISQPPYFASFWVEGIPVIWAVLLLAKSL